MPSKIADEINKLRGERAATQQTYMETLATLADEVQAINVTIINLESDIKKSLSRDIKKVQGDAVEAKTTSLPTSGGQLSGELDMSGHDIIGVSDLEAEDDAVGIGFYNAASALTLGIDSSGNLTPQGTVDGRDLDTDGTKLDGCDTGSKNDQTGAEIKTAYEAELDTNAYDDAAVTKLGNIEASATADQSDAEVKTAIENASSILIGADTLINGHLISRYSGDSDVYGLMFNYDGYLGGNTLFRDFYICDGKQATIVFIDGSSKETTFNGNIITAHNVDGRDVSTDGIKLDAIEASATADQTNAEIKAAVEAATDSNTFTDADHTKLNGVATSATANPDIAAGITPTCDGGWSTAGGTSGSTLGNITNNDMDSLSVEGSLDDTVGTDIITVDLASLQNIREISYGFQLYSEFQQSYPCYGYVESSPDNSVWTTLATHTSNTNGSYVPFSGNVRPHAKIRYIRLRFVSTTTTYLKKYKVNDLAAREY